MNIVILFGEKNLQKNWTFCSSIANIYGQNEKEKQS